MTNPGPIEALDRRGCLVGNRHQVLLGVTGSGKTFTMAHVIARPQTGPRWSLPPTRPWRPSSTVNSRSLFPENAVEYFVSYYDYYQPEAYIPASDTYIQKDSSINEMIDKMRHSATRSVLSRRDVMVVASVSCIFGLGAPEDYLAMRVDLETDTELDRDRLLADLVAMHYDRNDMDFHRGVFRVRGDRVEIFPAYEEDARRPDRFFRGRDRRDRGNRSAAGQRVIRRPEPSDHLPGQPLRHRKRHPASGPSRPITAELKERIDYFRNGKPADRGPAHRGADPLRPGNDAGTRLLQRHRELLPASDRPTPGRAAADPARLFPRRFPAVHRRKPHRRPPAAAACTRATARASRPWSNYGFRLPSALDNRPLQIRGVRITGSTGRLCVGHPGRLRAGAWPAPPWSSKSSGPPA